FYAGAPLLTKDGYSLGAMCVLGTEPHQVTAEEIAALKDLSAMVMAQIDLQHAVGRVDSSTGLPNYNQFIEDLDDLSRDAPGAVYYALSTELVDLSQASSLQRVMRPSYLEGLSRAASHHLRQSLGHDTCLYHIGPCQFAHLQTGAEDQVLAHARQLRDDPLALNVDDTAPFMLRPVVGVAPFVLGECQASAVLRTAHSASRDAREAEQSVG